VYPPLHIPVIKLRFKISSLAAKMILGSISSQNETAQSIDPSILPVPKPKTDEKETHMLNTLFQPTLNGT
jgi:hypothetical protein